MKFIAHRGSSHAHPENTLPAFDAVLAHPEIGRSVAGIEMDLRLTADHRIAIMHDATISDRQGTVHPVAKRSLSEIRTIVAANQETSCPTQVPQLEQVLDRIDHRTSLYLEIKDGDYIREELIGRLVSLLNDYSPRGDIIISSFSSHILSSLLPRTRHLEIGYALIFNHWEILEKAPESLTRNLSFLHPDYRLLLRQPDWLARCSHRVQCWTVNDRVTLKSLKALPGASKIDAMMTDELDLCLREW